MPRPKGSKNKSSVYVSDEKILKCQKEIEDLQAKLKEKKAELKALKNAKTKADKQKLYDAIETSNISVEELLALIKDKKSTSFDESSDESNADRNNVINFDDQADTNQATSQATDQSNVDQDIIE